MRRIHVHLFAGIYRVASGLSPCLTVPQIRHSPASRVPAASNERRLLLAFRSMSAFAFDNSPYPIRADLVAAYRGFWEKLAKAGTWWTGAERVAIAAEVRQATQCAYCAERKAALSPYNFPGEHSSAEGTPLDATAIDAVHRIVTDQTRITKSWIDDNAANRLPQGKYVELIGVVVCLFSIDEFCRALGLPLEPLPSPLPGEPSRYVPHGLENETAMVAMIRDGQGGPEEGDLWPAGGSANVVRALSQVPDAVREWSAIGDVQYLPLHMVPQSRCRYWTCPGPDANRTRCGKSLFSQRVLLLNGLTCHAAPCERRDLQHRGRPRSSTR